MKNDPAPSSFEIKKLSGVIILATTVFRGCAEGAEKVSCGEAVAHNAKLDSNMLSLSGVF